MAEFITVAKYHDSDPKVLLLRSRLEAEGIECFIKNEFVVYTKGSRPPELQIREIDLEMALPVLHEMGFHIPEEEQEHYNSFFQKFDSKTAGIPFLKNLKVEVRLTILTILFVGILSTFFFSHFSPAFLTGWKKTDGAFKK